jgi:hypothetical protein
MFRRIYTIIIVILVLIIIAFILFLISKTQGLSSSPIDTNSILNEPIYFKDTKRLRKIIVQDEETGECLEISNDGVVKRYETCEGKLMDSTRLFDPKRIIQLFEYASRIDPSKYRSKPEGSSIRLILYTDSGTEIVYVPVTDDEESISEIIDLIVGDLPQPTPTEYVIPGTPTPTLPGTTIIPTSVPTATLYPGITPTPGPTGQQQPFTCGFFDDPYEQRPYNVTNAICSTEPSPAP